MFQSNVVLLWPKNSFDTTSGMDGKRIFGGIGSDNYIVKTTRAPIMDIENKNGSFISFLDLHCVSFKSFVYLQAVYDGL